MEIEITAYYYLYLVYELDAMSLEKVQKVYEKLGEDDPLWAILTDNNKRSGKWDLEEFFGSGRDEINDVMNYLKRIDANLKHGNALDFGCGVGRLTQGLCHHFDKATGVDISNTMIDGAKRFNKFGKKCTYITNTEPHLNCLESETFDLVYTNIVLQHMPARFQVGYIKEFFRVLKPGGTALFQVRTAKGYRHGSLGAKLHDFKMEKWKPFWKIVRGRPPIQVHTISPEVVEKVIAECGASLIDVQITDKRIRKNRKSMRYCALKPL